MSRRRRALLVALAAAALLVIAVAAWGCHGHVIRAEFVPNHGERFDFRQPPCEPGPQPSPETGEVLLRYLGAGGLYIEWRGEALLTAPFFSNHGLLRAGLGRATIDEGAVREGMQGIDLGRVRAVLAGHAHYDHIGDLPAILPDLPERTSVWVNRSGRNVLANCPGADGRIEVLEDRAGEWITLRDSGGPLPIRFLPIPSGHAPHMRFYHYADGEVKTEWDDCLAGRRLRGMKEGRAFAFLIDLLWDDGSLAFRIHQQDAASRPPAGFPPDRAIEAGGPADLAVLCMPSFWLAGDYPAGILRRTRARHALVVHYEDFFRPRGKPLRFVPMLTDRRANRFMERLSAEMASDGHEPAGPVSGVCGPSGPSWTMPLVGEWLRFGR